jgi:uncharacterized protein YacL
MSANYQSSPTEQRSLAELVRELRDESILLVRQEVDLAKTEMGEKASRLGRNAATLIIGGAVAHLGLIFLLLAAVAGLELIFAQMDLPFHGQWLSPLIVGLIVGVVGLAMAMSAKNTLANMSVVPAKTVQTLKDDKQWIKEKI